MSSLDSALEMIKSQVVDSTLSYEIYSGIMVSLSIDEKIKVSNFLESEKIKLINKKNLANNDKKVENKKKKSDVKPKIKNEKLNDENIALCKEIQRGNKQAENDLCEKNEQLVKKFAQQYYKAHSKIADYEDLVQEGYDGLCVAAKKFDLSRNTAFSTCAHLWIRQRILKYISTQCKTINISEGVLKKVIKASDLYIELESEGKTYTEIVELISKELKCKKNKACEYLNYGFNELNTTSLNATVGDDEPTEIEVFVPASEETAEDAANEEFLHDDLAKLLSNLTDREKEIVMSRFGFLDGKGRTLEEIANEWGVTRERVCQIEFNALEKLKEIGLIKNIDSYLTK